MQKSSRRAFTESMLGSLFTFTLVKKLYAGHLLRGSVLPITRRWLLEMEEVSKAMKEGKVQPLEWQQQIEALLARLEFSDLLRAIDYERMAKHAVFPADHESAEGISFAQTEGLSSELTFAPFFYAMKKDVAIVPHGHYNMTSMHMILEGQAHAWLYERVSAEPQHLIIKPTVDKVFKRGNLSTISDQKNNVHWFKALTGPVFMFNIGVFGINPSLEFSGREYIDPANGEKLKDGLIRARRLKVNEAYKLYGKT